MVNQIKVLIWTLSGFIVISSFALLSLFASFSTDPKYLPDSNECLPALPTATITVHLAPGSSGALIPYRLPRSSQEPNSSTNVEFNLSWAASGINDLNLSYYFFYNAQLSIEYPVYKITLSALDKNGAETGTQTKDYTNDCTNPRGMELFAGMKTGITSALMNLPGSSPDQQIRIKIWSGQY